MLYRYLKVIDLLIQYLHIDIVTSAIITHIDLVSVSDRYLCRFAT